MEYRNNSHVLPPIPVKIVRALCVWWQSTLCMMALFLNNPFPLSSAIQKRYWFYTQCSQKMNQWGLLKTTNQTVLILTAQIVFSLSKCFTWTRLNESTYQKKLDWNVSCWGKKFCPCRLCLTYVHTKRYERNPWILKETYECMKGLFSCLKKEIWL